MPNYGYYSFNAGINYRDSMRAINELSTAKNVYWNEGCLNRRKGYAVRNATLVATAYHASADVIKVLGQYHYQWGTADDYFLFAAIDAGGGSVADKMTVFHSSGGLPGSAVTFTCLGTAAAMPWVEGYPFGIQQAVDKIFLVNGEDDPYVLHINSAGTSWEITELPLCILNNTGGSNGWAGSGQIIAGDEWDGCDWVTAVDTCLSIGNRRRVFMAAAGGIAGSAADMAMFDPAMDITGTAGAVRTGIGYAWDPGQFRDLDPLADIHSVASYKSYTILGGRKSTWRYYIRSLVDADVYIDKIIDAGVRSEICATPKGIFWVGEDGIFYYNGTKAENIGMKIWDHIRDQHTTLPGDLEDVSIAYHRGYVWISFPNSTDKEIWVFDPGSIYQWIDGNLYAAFYKFMYRRNLIDRKDCESTTPPMIFDETVPALTNATFARDEEEHTGTYSYKVVKTVAAGTVAYVYLTDNANTTNMHGLVAGHTYTWTVWVYIPSTGGIALNELYLYIRDYASGAWQGTPGTYSTVLDTWQRISVTRTIRAGATGVNFRLNIKQEAADTEYFYVDDIELSIPTGHEMDFNILRVFEDKLYVINEKTMYELQTSYVDDSSGFGINTAFETADLDFESPNKKKIYGRLVLETSPALETLLTHTLLHTRDYGEETVSQSGIDTTYTGAKRVHVERRVPYQMDGEAYKVKLSGDAAGCSASGSVKYYGVSVEAMTRSIVTKERA